jgi:hypothetical protein
MMKMLFSVPLEEDVSSDVGICAKGADAGCQFIGLATEDATKDSSSEIVSFTPRQNAVALCCPPRHIVVQGEQSCFRVNSQFSSAPCHLEWNRSAWSA